MTSGDRPISAVLQDIVGNVQDIIRAEVSLAKTELREQLAKARSAALLLAIGVVATIFACGIGLLALVLGLSLIMPQWGAALVVAIALAIVSIVTLAVGLKRLRTIEAAPKTTATIRENVEWAKQLTR